MKNSLLIKRLVGIAVLTALVVVFTLLSNYITIGTVNITLALIPIAVGAILYGPLVGFFLGAVMGALVISAPSTIAYFLPVNAWATVVLCILKSALAGLAAGFAYKGLAHFAKKASGAKKKTIIVVAATVATILVPIVNTTLFIFGASAFFGSVYGTESFGEGLGVVFAAVFGPNFAIEATISIVLSPAVVTVIKILTRNYNLGFANDFSSLIEEDEDETLGAIQAEAQKGKQYGFISRCRKFKYRIWLL